MPDQVYCTLKKCLNNNEYIMHCKKLKMLNNKNTKMNYINKTEYISLNRLKEKFCISKNDILKITNTLKYFDTVQCKLKLNPINKCGCVFKHNGCNPICNINCNNNCVNNCYPNNICEPKVSSSNNDCSKCVNLNDCTYSSHSSDCHSSDCYSSDCHSSDPSSSCPSSYDTSSSESSSSDPSSSEPSSCDPHLSHSHSSHSHSSYAPLSHSHSSHSHSSHSHSSHSHSHSYDSHSSDSSSSDSYTSDSDCPYKSNNCFIIKDNDKVLLQTGKYGNINNYSSDRNDENIRHRRHRYKKVQNHKVKRYSNHKLQNLKNVRSSYKKKGANSDHLKKPKLYYDKNMNKFKIKISH